MGLDIYVGTLTRYYARDWKTIVQQTMPTKVVYQGKNAQPPPADAIADQAEIQRIVTGWRAQVEKFTKDQISGDWNWDEKPGVPYWTDKPGWYGHNALRVVALEPRVDRSQKLGAIPDHLPGEWGGLETAATKEYRHVIWPQWWLPMKFDHIFSVSSPSSEPKVIGSIDTLIKELKRLNDATIRADAKKVEWYRSSEGLPQALEDWTVEQAFGFGLGVFLRLAEQARSSRLPMLLDW